MTGIIALVPGLLISLVAAGLMLRVLGTITYGVWAVATATLLYLSVSDFGLGWAVQRFLSEYRVRSATAEQAVFIGTVAVAYLAIAAIIVAASFGVGLALPSLTKHVVGTDQTIPTALFLGVAVAFTLWMNAVLGALHAWQHLPLANLVRGFYGAGAGTAPLVMSVIGLGLGGAALGLAANAALWFVVALVFARREIPSLKLAPPRARVMRQVLGYSAVMFAMGVGAMIVFGSDSVVIGAILGPAAVPAYALALRGTRSATFALHKVADALFPTFAALKATSDLDSTRRWYSIAARVELAGSVFLALTIFPAGQTILALWLGPSNVLVLPAFALAVLLILLEAAIHPAAILAGAAGGERPLAGVNNIEAIANIGLSLALIRPWGVTGVIAGTICAQVCTNLWWLPRWAKRHLHWSWHDYVAEIIAPCVLPGAAGGGSAGVVWLLLWHFYPPADGVLSGLAGGITFALTYGIRSRELPEIRRVISLATAVRMRLHKPTANRRREPLG